jgi:hypothetical protein
VLGYGESASVASEIAAEVVDFLFSEVCVADTFDVVSVLGICDVDLADVNKFL